MNVMSMGRLLFKVSIFLNLREFTLEKTHRNVRNVGEHFNKGQILSDARIFLVQGNSMKVGKPSTRVQTLNNLMIHTREKCSQCGRAFRENENSLRT